MKQLIALTACLISLQAYAAETLPTAQLETTAPTAEGALTPDDAQPLKAQAPETKKTITEPSSTK